MTEVGHGVLGMRSGLRVFNDLQLESISSKDAYVEIEGAVLLGDSDQLAFDDALGELALGADAAEFTWLYAWDESFDDEVLDVTGVAVLAEVLARAQSEAHCAATAGTFHHDAGSGYIRVHLTGGADPTGQSVRVTTTFRFCTGGGRLSGDMMVQPVLGEELLTDRGFEALTSWTEDKTGSGWTTSRGNVPLVEGTHSLNITSTGAAVGYGGRWQANAYVMSGRRYRAFGYYSTGALNPSTAKAYVRVGTATTMSSDGRSPEATLTDGAQLLPTVGHSRAFCFDFVAHENAPRIWFRMVNSVATACEAMFDLVSVTEIRGWARYHPRCTVDGIPDASQGSADVYPSGQDTGSGMVKVLNGDDGYAYRLFSGNRSFVNRAVSIRFGGAFPDGQEILLNDMHVGISGVLSGDKPISVNDSQAELQVEDLRSVMEVVLPTEAFDDAGEQRDNARPIPLIFGLSRNTRPSRRALDVTTGYGEYVVCDTSFWAPGISGTGSAGGTGNEVYSYLNEEAANKLDSTKRVALDSTKGDYTQNALLGTMEITHDVRLIEITRENCLLDFVTGVTTAVALIPLGLYYIGDGHVSVATNRRGLLDAIRVAMNTALAGTYGLVYDEATHKVTISRSGGNINLMWKTGTNRASSVGPTLGFDADTDDTGGSTYTGPDSLFKTSDDHIIRADVNGFRDDSSGTYTGIIDGSIFKASDVLRWLLRVVLGLPSWRVDTASFDDARSTCGQVLSIYLGASSSIGGGAFTLTLQQIVDRFEAGAFADVVMDGSGIFYFKKRSSTVPDDAPRLYDRDYLDFRGFYAAQDVYGTVRINYAQDPTTGIVKGSELTNDDTILRDSRQHLRTFDSFLTETTDADAAVILLATLARAAIRHFELRVKGKLLKCKVGDLIILTRSQALLGAGDSALVDGVFRIMWISKNFLTHEVRAIVHTNIVS